MHFRRRVPRQPAGWDGVCQIEGEFAARCRVIDISMLGSESPSSPLAVRARGTSHLCRSSRGR